MIYFRKKILVPFVFKRNIKVSILVISILGIFLIPNVFSNNFSNIYVSTATSIKNTLFYDKVEFNSTLDSFNYEEISSSTISPSKEKIFVFVMEGVDMQEVQSHRYQGDILDVMQDNLHSYSNFYTQNQDSRTSLMSFLSGTFIPYEAYLYNFEYVYGHIFNQSSILENFERHEYNTHYLISSMDIPEIGFLYPWNTSHSLNSFPIPNFTCVHQIANQRACEDEVFLDEVLTLLLDNSKLFIFQEGVYGHGSDFFKLEKKNSYFYYSEYLKKIFFELEMQEKLDDVKIVIVSDHGSKGRTQMEKISGYHIPLFIYDTNFTPENFSELYTHLDLEELIFEIEVEPREDFFIVGSTMSQIVAYYNGEEYGFMNFGKRPYIFKKSKNLSYQELEMKFSSFKKYQSDYFRE